PRDALPLARAAFADALERVFHARRVVHAGAVAGALLTAARIEVGGIGADRRVVSGLLLAPHQAILDEHIPRAVGLIPAIHEVRAAYHFVPGPFAPVDVLPRAVGRDRWRHGACG